MRIVADSSPLILLASCGQLELLPALADPIVVPQTVLLELEAGLVPKVRPIVEAMMRQGYYLAGSVLERALHAVGE